MDVNIAAILKHFLTSLAAGSFLFLPIVSPRLTGSGFHRLILWVATGAHVLALFIGERSSFSLYLVLLVVLMGLISQIKEKWSLISWVGYGAGIIGYGVLFYRHFSSPPQLVSVMLYLGVINFSMLLGHYYLVVPKLTERPLKQLLRIFYAVALIKLALLFIGLWELKASSLDLFTQVIISMRVLFGLVTPIAMSLFCWRLVTTRSIQSATGVFYAMEFFIIAGELASLYLFYQNHLVL